MTTRASDRTDVTPQQRGIASLEECGFKFFNWIAANPDADNQPSEGTEAAQVAVMVKRSKHGTEYREVEPDGTIN